jgi:type IX secretion system PorP/SprF family membrane protein
MKKQIKKIVTLLLPVIFSGFSVSIVAQDLHFSQYFNSPLLVNPANTGFIPDGDYRLGANYRKQWASVTTNPYRTFSVFGDGQLFGDRLENGWVGVGGSILRDVAGTGNLTSTKTYGSIAYHQAVGLGSLISAGFNLGWVNKRVDFTKLTFDNQWNGKFFDVAIPTGEAFAVNQINYFTLQAGLNYAYYPNEETYLNAGFSVSNINRPNESFFKSDAVDERIAPRYTAFLNGSFKAGDNTWIINPNVYVSKMSTAWEIVAGANAQRNLSGDGSSQLILGAYYRANDAIIPMVGFQQGTYKLTVSYDATTSSLTAANGSKGGYELSIIKQGIFDPSRPLKCPAVRF